MSIAIKAQANLNYGGTLVSEKYSPLYKVDLSTDDKELCSKVFTNRSELLASLGVLPGTLELVANNWTQIFKSQTEHTKPPLVVVSSNRSKWIRAGIEEGDRRLEALGLPHFDGVNDLRALQREPARQHINSPNPPIYSPKRIVRKGKLLDRNVYIVVASSEFREYHANLTSKGITVIGWDFKDDKSLNGFVDQSLNGFGASRFAAIQFCKTLRTDASSPWDYIWLFDDNVVAIEQFIGLDDEEQLIKNGKDACFGFHGANVAQSNNKNYRWAMGWERPRSNDKPVARILQQAVLWNIKYLTDKNLNFPPIFLASAEDVSLSRYLDREKIPYSFFKDKNIRKEVTTYDGHSELLPLTDYFAKLESMTTLNNPPPPVGIENKGERFIVSFFVDYKVLLNSDLPDTRAKVKNAPFRNKAACQAVEQIMKVAIQSRDWVDDDALTATFMTPTVKQKVQFRGLGLKTT